MGDSSRKTNASRTADSWCACGDDANGPRHSCLLTNLLCCSRFSHEVVAPMASPKLSKLELQILEALWATGKASIREIQEAFPEPRPAYTTIQTTVNRLETKQAVRRVRKISNAHIYEPAIA